MSVGKIIMTILGLIALFLVLNNSNAFNTALKTSADTALKGVAVLQGRSGAVVG